MNNSTIMIIYKIKSLINSLSGPKSLCLVLLLLGIFFRFVNLDQKIYWRDEALTSLQISGYTQKEFIQQTFNGQILSSEDLQKYVHIRPEKSLTDTINALATETPEHPPLYYIMLRLWVQYSGDSVAVIRSLSAFLSLLVFPCIYWLCMELFKSPTVGWMAVGLIAVSPFHVQYAQQAREYSFWTVTTLLSSAVLLQAMRQKTRVSWAIYAATLAIGLYGYSFFVFVAIAHGLYILITSNFRFTKTLISYFAASIIGFITFIPWIWTTIYHLPEVNRSMEWTKEKASLLDLFKMWFSNMRLIFFDLEIPKIPSFSLFYSLVLCITVLIGYSIYFLCRHTPKQVWLFVLILIISNSLPLMLPDVIFGGTRSTTARYWIPCYLAIHLSIAYLFTTKITSIEISQPRKFLKIIIAIVISGQVLACAVNANTKVSISNPSQNEKLSQLINQTNHPLVVSSNYKYNPTELLSLSYLLDSKVRLQLVKSSDLPDIPNKFSDVFVYSPFGLPPVWQDELPKKYNLEPVQQLIKLWKLTKIN
ncbi:glycosyltransferase family 39 protein [Microcoleus sp. w1-18aA5]|uniref:glycosyltransferase family 39 protein n=1 Tax=unclassified Microcoleus TaxID=2642155 RepID=UPI002FD56E1E